MTFKRPSQPKSTEERQMPIGNDVEKPDISLANNTLYGT